MTEKEYLLLLKKQAQSVFGGNIIVPDDMEEIQFVKK